MKIVVSKDKKGEFYIALDWNWQECQMDLFKDYTDYRDFLERCEL